jgi:hypothetical protein
LAFDLAFPRPYGQRSRQFAIDAPESVQTTEAGGKSTGPSRNYTLTGHSADINKST